MHLLCHLASSFSFNEMLFAAFKPISVDFMRIRICAHINPHTKTSIHPMNMTECHVLFDFVNICPSLTSIFYFKHWMWLQWTLFVCYHSNCAWSSRFIACIHIYNRKLLQAFQQVNVYGADLTIKFLVFMQLATFLTLSQSVHVMTTIYLHFQF